MSETGVLEPLKPSIRRKITLSDLGAIAEYVANRVTEVEACSMLGINYHVWQNWKGRNANNVKFETALSRIKGEGIKTHLDRISKASEAVNAKTGIPEWRASEAYLKLSDPARFAAPPSQISLNLLVNGVPNDLIEAARDAFKRNSRPQPVVSCGPPLEPIEHKTLPDVATPSPATDV